MKRIALTSGNDGTWFDRDAAIQFSEQTRWDGRNSISLATGSQWEHEALYYTKGGRWVLNHWSQWQGSRETYEEIGAPDAAAWLITNECLKDDGYAQLPEDARTGIEKLVAAAEL